MHPSDPQVVCFITQVPQQLDHVGTASFLKRDEIHIAPIFRSINLLPGNSEFPRKLIVANPQKESTNCINLMSYLFGKGNTLHPIVSNSHIRTFYELQLVNIAKQSRAPMSNTSHNFLNQGTILLSCKLLTCERNSQVSKGKDPFFELSYLLDIIFGILFHCTKVSSAFSRVNSQACRVWEVMKSIHH